MVGLLIGIISYILITLYGRGLFNLEGNIAWVIVFISIYIVIVFLCKRNYKNEDWSTVLMYILFIFFKFIFFCSLFYLEYCMNCSESRYYGHFNDFRFYKKYKYDPNTLSLLFFSNIGVAFFNICLLVYSYIVSKISLLSVFIFGFFSSLIMFLSLFSYIEMTPAAIVAGLILFEVLSIIIPVIILNINHSIQGVNPFLSQLRIDYYRFIPIMLLIYIFVLLIFYLFLCVLYCACGILASICGVGTPAYVDKDGNYYDECKDRIYFVI